MKLKYLRGKNQVELVKLRQELKEKIFQAKILKAQNQLKKPEGLKQLKKDLARVLTLRQNLIKKETSRPEK